MFALGEVAACGFATWVGGNVDVVAGVESGLSRGPGRSLLQGSTMSWLGSPRLGRHYEARYYFSDDAQSCMFEIRGNYAMIVSLSLSLSLFSNRDV